MTKKTNEILTQLLPALVHELAGMPVAQRQETIGTFVTALTIPAGDNREVIQTLLKASITVFLMTEQDNSRTRFMQLVDRGFDAADLRPGN